jgi:hypothetical protein
VEARINPTYLAINLPSEPLHSALTWINS